jgi:flagellar hook-associated protein 3 FlgL
MSRVSESSSFHAINHSVGKTKEKLENLQIKGSNLKRVQKPSDDPIGNVELLGIRSQEVDAGQYLRNISYAKAQLTFTENAIEELTNILVKAKEIAIGQSSNLFGADVRKSVAKEVEQLKNQAISISNRRLGSKYIFGGYKNLSKPFNSDGTYNGDDNQTKLEVSKDFFIPVNFSGNEIFFDKMATVLDETGPLEGTDLIVPIDGPNSEEQSNNPMFNQSQQPEPQINRTPANDNPDQTLVRRSIFQDLKTLNNALLTNNHEIIQDLLPQLDGGIDRLIEIRTKIGSTINSIDNAENNIEKTKLMHAEYRTRIEDADVAELFTDLSRQQNVLNATYKSSAQLMNNSLLDFIR